MSNIYDLFNLIGDNLRNIRNKKIKMTQEEFAEDIEMSRGFISQIEGQNVNTGVSLDTLFYIAQKYNFDIRDFFDGYEKLMKENNN